MKTPAATPRFITLSLERLGHAFRRLMPTSLFGRSLLIIVLPVAIMQIAVTWVFFDAHWETVTSRLSEGLAGDVAWAVESYRDDPSPAALAKIAQRAERSMSLSIVLQEGRTLPTGRRPSLFAALDRSLQKALEARLDAPFWFDTTRYPAYVDIRVQTPKGVLRIIAPRDRAFATQGHIFILWMTGVTLLLTGIAIGFIRNQVRAIERLAEAADAFGRGGDVEAFKPYGAREVRQAAAAFISMKDRIQRHIEQRTVMLAAVGHDLRTPLTRLKLELALAEPSDRIAAMKGDLAEMEHMIDDYLDFARGEGGEAAEAIILADLIRTIAQGAAHLGAKIDLAIVEDLEVLARPIALKRALSNLVMNAAGHGRQVLVSARRCDHHGIEITVEDDGPGIDPARYEEAFRPFSRLDESRNQNEKGVGLGLAIARDVARNHGGDVTLGASSLGGLKAIMRLPSALA
jgi:two-component system osmolarity sensor histidine kinase EnvZ